MHLGVTGIAAGGIYLSIQRVSSYAIEKVSEVLESHVFYVKMGLDEVIGILGGSSRHVLRCLWVDIPPAAF